jgi:isoleucyl-tRNA synthetase
VKLAEDDVLVETAAPQGYRVEQDGGRTVALCTVVDEALREEGLVRELVHAVQLSRKNADLRIEDTIDLALSLSPGLRAVAERHAAYIRSETLASALSLDGGTRDHSETARVEGDDVGIALSVTGTIYTVSYA